MHTQQPRINLTNPTIGEVKNAMFALEEPLRKASLEPALRELVKIRASQINGCAYCLDMHTQDARAKGESEQRLYLVNAWREAPFYSDRERAALEWTEQLTTLAGRDVPDDLYQRMTQNFSETEIVHLTLLIVQANGWNRFAMSFRAPAGSYHPAQAQAAAVTQ